MPLVEDLAFRRLQLAAPSSAAAAATPQAATPRIEQVGAAQSKACTSFALYLAPNWADSFSPQTRLLAPRLLRPNRAD